MPPLEPKPFEPNEKEWQPFQSPTVFAVFDGRAQADVAARRLVKAGIDEDRIRLLSGRPGLADLDASGKRQGLLTRAARRLSDVTTYLENYDQALQAGKVLAAVRFLGEEDRTTIEAILIDSGGVRMCYTTDWTITEIVERSRTA
jgi:hypothetical protein